MEEVIMVGYTYLKLFVDDPLRFITTYG